MSFFVFQMSYLYNLMLSYILFNSEIISKHVSLPFSLNRYDQSDVFLEEEDRRDLFRGIKTVYAPEYRIYTNGSIGGFTGRDKRELYEYYRPKEFFEKCKAQKTTSLPEEEVIPIEMGKNNNFENFDIDDGFLDTVGGNSWLNYTNYIDPDIRREQELHLNPHRNLTNISSVDLSVFWHSQVGTQDIRKIQGNRLRFLRAF